MNVNKDFLIGFMISVLAHSSLLFNKNGMSTLITSSQNIGQSGKGGMSMTVVTIESSQEVRSQNRGINLSRKKNTEGKKASPSFGLEGLSDNESSQGNSNGIIGKYLGDLRQSLERNKIYPLSGKKLGHEGKVMVSFIVKKDGALEQMKIETPSEFETLNKGAIETLERFQNFRPFPQEIGEEILKVKMLLVFNLKDGERI